MGEHRTAGRVVSINVSGGGVPKLPVAHAQVTTTGLVGDRQNDTQHHGGPERAVSVYAIEVIERLRAEGHPIAPGACGENLTIAGIDWVGVAPGTRLRFDGGVVLEVASYCSPCKTIRAAFRDEDSTRISQKLHPGDSRVYTRVLTTGFIRAGEGVVIEPPSGQVE